MFYYFHNFKRFLVKLRLFSIAGFSLVELLVSVGILGAISGIAIPSYLSYKNSSKKALVVSVLMEAYDKIESNQLLDLDTQLSELNEMALAKANNATWRLNTGTSQVIDSRDKSWCLEINLGDSAYNKAASCITSDGDFKHASSSGGTDGTCGAGCTSTAVTCSGGQVWNGSACVCRGGLTWDGTSCVAPACTGGRMRRGTYCVCPTGRYWDGSACVMPCTGGRVRVGTNCVCPGGKVWNGTSCNCPTGRHWDGSNCVVCNAPRSWTGSVCECSGGRHWDGSNCVACDAPRTWTGSACVCSGGRNWDGTNCNCPTTGQIWDGTSCVASCPSGTIWNSADNKCICTGQGHTWNTGLSKCVCASTSKLSIGSHCITVQRCNNKGGAPNYVTKTCDCLVGRVWTGGYYGGCSSP